FLVLDFAVQGREAIDHAGDQLGDVGHAEIGFDVADRPADVGGDQVKQLFRPGRVTTDAQVAADHDNGDVDSTEQIDQIIIESSQLGVAVAQLVVDRYQFLVRRLGLLLGGLKLLVGTLQ